VAGHGVEGRSTISASSWSESRSRRDILGCAAQDDARVQSDSRQAIPATDRIAQTSVGRRVVIDYLIFYRVGSHAIVVPSIVNGACDSETLLQRAVIRGKREEVDHE
jgi:hypothetical protein